MENIILAPIIRDLKHYFGFLLDRGFKISNARYIPDMAGFWSVQLESPECVIEIYNDRNDLFLMFLPVNGDRDSGIGLEPMIYFITQGRIFIADYERHSTWHRKKQFEKWASLLKQYLDQITPYFGRDSYRYRNDMLSAQKQYNQLYTDRAA